VHPLSEPALTRPLAALASELPSARPAGLQAARADPRGAELIAEFGLPVCPGIHFTVADQWQIDRRMNATVIGKTSNHHVSLDLQTGMLWAVPSRPHLTESLFVNSTLPKFIDFIWRWASLDSVLEGLSHDIQSFDVTDDFLAYVHQNDPTPSGVDSLWVSWADTD